jgi:predicted dehydrogenase
VHAVCGFGRRHEIEVEDEATAVLEYPGGMTGTFITATGEAPGTNRLEIAGTRGRVVLEGATLTVTTNTTPSDDYCRRGTDLFGRPKTRETVIPVALTPPLHETVTRNFVAAILDGAEPVAPLEDGVRQVELANAMLLSSLRDRPVDLPLDAAAFGRRLRGLVRAARTRKVRL